MRRDEVIRHLMYSEWEWDEENHPYRRIHYDKEGNKTDMRTYLDMDDLVQICQQFYLLGKHDAEYNKKQ